MRDFARRNGQEEMVNLLQREAYEEKDSDDRPCAPSPLQALNTRPNLRAAIRRLPPALDLGPSNSSSVVLSSGVPNLAFASFDSNQHHLDLREGCLYLPLSRHEMYTSARSQHMRLRQRIGKEREKLCSNRHSSASHHIPLAVTHRVERLSSASSCKLPPVLHLSLL